MRFGPLEPSGPMVPQGLQENHCFTGYSTVLLVYSTVLSQKCLIIKGLLVQGKQGITVVSVNLVKRAHETRG